MNDKDNEKVSIKLERHRWPDEINKEKKRKQRRIVIVVAIILAFSFGFVTRSLFSNNIVSNSNETNVFNNVYNVLVNDWFFGNDMEDPASEILNNAINGMIDLNGDIHTSYLTQEEAIQLNESINMNFVGIGVGYQMLGDNFIITKVYRGSPAEKAGVEPGDVLVSVNGVSVEEKSSDELKEDITGEAGTDVIIEFMRSGKIIEFTITRESINAVAWGEILDNNVGYIEITSFGNGLATIVQSYLEQFKEAGVKGLIIDLRDNGGGYLAAIQDLGPLFFEDGQILYQEEFKDGTIDKYAIKKSVANQYKMDKTVILINGSSASASEVLAAAFQENTDASIMGSTSYGKGTVQTTTQLTDGSVLKYTIARWLSPSGKSIHGEGVTPDQEVLLEEIFYAEFIEMEEGEVHPYDSVAPSVGYAQKALKYLGLHTGRTDGYFDQATLEALKNFNTKFGFESEAIDESTLTHLYQEVASDWNINRKDKDIQLNKAIDWIES